MRRTLVLGLSVLAFASLVGCAGGADQPATTAEAVEPGISQEDAVQSCFDAWRDGSTQSVPEGHFESRYSTDSVITSADGESWNITLIPHTAPEAEWNLYCVVSDEHLEMLDAGYEDWPDDH